MERDDFLNRLKESGVNEDRCSGIVNLILQGAKAAETDHLEKIAAAHYELAYILLRDLMEDYKLYKQRKGQITCPEKLAGLLEAGYYYYCPCPVGEGIPEGRGIRNQGEDLATLFLANLSTAIHGEKGKTSEEFLTDTVVHIAGLFKSAYRQARPLPPFFINQQHIIPYLNYRSLNLLIIWLECMKEVNFPEKDEILRDALESLRLTITRYFLPRSNQDEDDITSILRFYINRAAYLLPEVFKAWSVQENPLYSYALEIILTQMLTLKLYFAENIETVLSSEELKQNLRKDPKTSQILEAIAAPQKDIKRQLPLTSWFARPEDLFANRILVLVLHFLRDLIPFIHSLCESLGAKSENIYLFCKPYPYLDRQKIVHNLREMDCKVFTADSSEEVEPRVRDMVREVLRNRQGREVLIIEDGGYVVPLIHSDAFVNEFGKPSEYCIGAVEQTTKGITRDELILKEKRLCIPVMNVARSEFKREYESPLVGRTIVRNIRTVMPEEHLEGKKALVIGFGAIGENVARCLSGMENMKVYVAENRDDRKLKAYRSDFVAKVVARAADVIGECTLIVGTTGFPDDKPSIGKEEIEKLSDGAWLVSASSDRGEIDYQTLGEFAGRSNIRPIPKVGTEYSIQTADKTKKVRLLADGYPINFYYSESVPNKSIDPILSELLLSAMELARRKNKGDPIEMSIRQIYGKDEIDPGEVDRLNDKNKLVYHFMRIHELG